MKKTMTMLLMLALALLCATGAFAEGVQMLQAPQAPEEVEPIDMSNIRLGTEIPIEGFGVITPLTCNWVDRIAYTGSYSSSWNSGDEAEYLVLTVEILNTQYVEDNFISNCQVSGEFGNGYVFGGWYRQYHSSTDNRVKQELEYSFPISPLYKGKYAFVLTLPNFVKDSTEPLSITVTLSDDVVMTYHIRK